jgi:hypothetical protein
MAMLSNLSYDGVVSHLMADRTFSRLQASPPNVLGYFQGTPGTPSNPTLFRVKVSPPNHP